MMFGKKNQFKDERITKEVNRIMPAMFWLLSAGLLAMLIVKLALGEPWYNYILEILCLVPSLAYLLIRGMSSGVLFVREKDEAITGIRNEIMSKAYMIAFFIVIFGELVYCLFVTEKMMRTESVGREMLWIGLYMASWFISAIIIFVFTIRKGWMIWGGQKREKTGKKQLAVRTAVGSLFFGLIVGGRALFSNGEFHPEGIITVLLIGAVWGILFYLLMVAFIKISEKNADKAVRKQEMCNEESQNEVSPSGM